MHAKLVSTMLSLYQIQMIHETSISFKRTPHTHCHIKATLLLLLLSLLLLPVQYAKSTKSCSLSLLSPLLRLPLFPSERRSYCGDVSCLKGMQNKEAFHPSAYPPLILYSLTSHSHSSHSDSRIMQTLSFVCAFFFFCLPPPPFSFLTFVFGVLMWVGYV